MNIKKTILVAVFFTACNVCNAQQAEAQLDSITIKKTLYHSLVCDNKICKYPGGYVSQFDNYYSNFEKFRYFKSKKLRLQVSPYSRVESNFDVYYVQLFKFYGGPDKPYYVLTIDNCRGLHFELKDDVWVRLTGYTESDIKLLFDYMINDQRLTMDDIRYMIDCWRKGDEMFAELDWDCLIDGYLKNDTRQDCYFSWAKINTLTSIYSTSWHPRYENRYSSFSTDFILCGVLW